MRTLLLNKVTLHPPFKSRSRICIHAQLLQLVSDMLHSITLKVPHSLSLDLRKTHGLSPN